MNRFVKKRKPVEHISSAKPIVRGETEISQAEEQHLILQVQRVLGNQAMQKTLQPGRLARSGMRSAGEYTLVQCLPDHPADRIMRQGLSAQTVTKWHSLVSAGFQEERQNNLKGMAANFAEALKLIGEPNVHVTTNGHADVKKLKPGINLDILFKEKPGRAGFLTKQEFTATLPMDATDPDSAILIGRNAFQSNRLLWTITVLEHELTHYPAEKGFWKLNSEAVKKQYQQTLTEFYCKTLNDPQKKAFDKHLVEYKNKKWQVDASKYFRMLEGITCKR